MRLKIPLLSILPLLLISVSTWAQTRISGKVVDMKDKPIKGASVSLDNTLDGGTTDSAGFFSFETTETGNQTLVANDATHSTMGMPLVITGAPITGLVLKMRTAVLETVTITAGSFASGGRAATVMSPLDIVTTAGSNGDVVKAMQMMPGTQQNNTDNGLFVRGGDAYEAAVIVDGIVTQSAFASGPPGVATRSRFNAFQYQGVQFSSGGYSARYGQALSAVLELNSTDLADKSNVNLGINMGGLYASGTKRWKKSSLDVGGSYTNLQPLYALASSNFNFYKVPVGGGAYARYAWTPNKSGIFKATISTTYNKSGITIPNPSSVYGDTGFMSKLGDKIDYETKDKYLFATATYKQMFKTKYSVLAAVSGSYDSNSNKFGPYPLKTEEYRTQGRIEGKDFINNRLSLMVGSDVQLYGVGKQMDSFHFRKSFDEKIVSAFAEVEWTPKYWLAIRPGLRYEYSAMLNTAVLAPRFSAAIKTGPNSQASLAGGLFYQDAPNLYYLSDITKTPGMSYAAHYIANWQYSKSDRTFRIEAYHKDYQHLVREYYPNADSVFVFNRNRILNPSIGIDNTGHGYADGLELFWRDKKSIKNADYWITYSFINTERLYENFPVLATPTFIAKHNFNVVGKYFIDKIHTNVSATYSYRTGFPYYDPTLKPLKDNFLTGTTPDYHNVALTFAYLHSFGKWFSVFYAQVDNVLNTKTVSGYRFVPDGNGVYTKQSIGPALYRTIFVGANFSLTQFSKDEL